MISSSKPATGVHFARPAVASSSGAMKIRDSGRTSDRSRTAHFESREVEIRGAWIFS